LKNWEEIMIADVAIANKHVVFGGKVYKILNAVYEDNTTLGLITVEVEPASEEVSRLLSERILRDRGLKSDFYKPIDLDDELEELQALSAYQGPAPVDPGFT
jgi:starvation-inducible outer membrane lipoprotein